MTLNCKQGDLAVILRSESGNEGKIVRCVCLHTSTSKDIDGVRFSYDEGPRWVLEEPISAIWHGAKGMCTLFTFPDAHLRPLRNDPGQDETLTWKDVPSTNEVAA